MPRPTAVGGLPFPSLPSSTPYHLPARPSAVPAGRSAPRVLRPPPSLHSFYAVPRDLCCPDMKKIKARHHSGVKIIPGVLITPKPYTSTRLG